MSKAEQLLKAIKASLAAVEPRRALCWRLCREHVARITPAHTVEDLANHFAAAFFAAEALNAEARGVYADDVGCPVIDYDGFKQADVINQYDGSGCRPYIIDNDRRRAYLEVVEL